MLHIALGIEDRAASITNMNAAFVCAWKRLLSGTSSKTKDSDAALDLVGLIAFDHRKIL